MRMGGGGGPSPPQQCPRPPRQSLVLARKAVPVVIRGARHAHLGARRRLLVGQGVGEAPGVSAGAGTTAGGGVAAGGARREVGGETGTGGVARAEKDPPMGDQEKEQPTTLTARAEEGVREVAGSTERAEVVEKGAVTEETEAPALWGMRVVQAAGPTLRRDYTTAEASSGLGPRRRR